MCVVRWPNTNSFTSEKILVFILGIKCKENYYYSQYHQKSCLNRRWSNSKAVSRSSSHMRRGQYILENIIYRHMGWILVVEVPNGYALIFWMGCENSLTKFLWFSAWNQNWFSINQIKEADLVFLLLWNSFNLWRESMTSMKIHKLL